MRKTTVLSALTLATVVLAGCGSAEKDNKAAPVDRTKVTQSETLTPAASTTTAAPIQTTTSKPVPKAADGSRDHPFELGQSAQVGSWLVTLLAFDSNADKEMAKDDLFNEKPKGQYVTTKVKAVYTGEEEGMPQMDLTQVIVADAKQFTDYDSMCSPPDQDDDGTQTLMPGGEATFWSCFDIPKGAVEKAEFFIEDSMAFEAERVYFKLEK